MEKKGTESPAGGKEHGRKASKPNPLTAALLAVIFLATVIFTCVSSAGALSGMAGSAAVLSAKLAMPAGGDQVVQSNIDGIRSLLSDSAQQNVAMKNSSSSSPSSSSSSSQSGSSSLPAGCKPVVTVQFGAQSGGGYETYDGVTVNNTTASSKADIQNQLAVKPDLKMSLGSSPEVLIVHTHATEAYSSKYTGYYDPEDSFRSLDDTKNVVRVGEEIAKYLRQSGIGVYHDKTVNDYPQYDGAFSRSLDRIKADMKKYPSIKVVVDVHREPIQYDDGTRVKPTASIGGKSAAQILLVVGDGEQNSSLTVPNWIWNYRFALRLEQQMNKSYAGLARPISLVDKQYNEQASRGSLLVQIGTDVNTLDEAVYSGQLFGKSLAQVLRSLKS